MISMELQREVPQYMAIPWLMTWVMARTVSAGREGESGRWGLAGAALAEGGSHRADGWRASHCPMLWQELSGVVSGGCFQKSRMGTEGAATQDVPGTTADLTCHVPVPGSPSMESSLMLLPVAPCPVGLPALALLQGRD